MKLAKLKSNKAFTFQDLAIAIIVIFICWYNNFYFYNNI